jgi:hypothetical protein
MKKVLGFFIAVAIILVPMNAIAAVKAGDICKKSGSTATASGKKFTCVKSGKKLVWNKGITIAKAIPASTPIPTPTPVVTPTPTPSPSVVPTPSISPTPTLDRNIGARRGTQFIYRVKDGVLERLIARSTEYTSVDTRLETEFDPIRVKAFDEIHKFKTTGAHPNVEIVYTITDSYPRDIAEAVRLGVESTANYLSMIIPEKIRVAVTLVTEKDTEFITAKIPELSRPDQVQVALNSVKRYQSGGIAGGSGSAGYNRFGAGFAGGFYLGTAASFSSVNFYWPEVPSHELAHVLQMYFSSKSNFNSYEAYVSKFPTNFIEGSANTLGHAWAVKNLGWYSDESDFTVKRYMESFPGSNRMQTEADVLDMLEKTVDSRDPVYFEMTYPVGQVLWEYMIGTYGFEKYITFLKNAYSTNSYADNIQVTYGISKEQVYKNAAPYILSVWKRAMSLPIGN